MYKWQTEIFRPGDLVFVKDQIKLKAGDDTDSRIGIVMSTSIDYWGEDSAAILLFNGTVLSARTRQLEFINDTNHFGDIALEALYEY